ncbi:MAG: hypothetical protein WCP36_02020 [Methanomicrobiales archaeon]
MKTKVSLGVVIIVMVILIAVSGSAMAARTVPAGNETSQIRVETSAHVIGNFYASTDLVLQQSTGDLVPPLAPGEQVNAVGYSETTMAVGGEATYNKDTQINTGGVTDNLQTTRMITFDGGDNGGRMISNEETIIATEGSNAVSAVGCCPWSSTENATIPAESEIVRAGSKMDVTQVSAASTSDATVISNTLGTPVTLDYLINAHGINQTPGTMDNPAIGSATAYVDGVIMQGNNGSTQSTDMQYHDVTSVDGLFDLSKDVSYSSAPS